MKDIDIQIALSKLLRAGVYISMAIVLLGGILLLVQNPYEQVNYSSFNAEAATFKEVKSIFYALASFNAEAIIALGILLLIATPILRLVFATLGFLLEKDYLYVIIGILVLSIIAFSLLNNIIH